MTSPQGDSRDDRPPSEQPDHSESDHTTGHDPTHPIHQEEQTENQGIGSTDPGSVVELSVPDMDCPSCAGKVKTSVGSLDGVTAVDPQVTTGTLSVSYEDERTARNAIAERVEKAG